MLNGGMHLKKKNGTVSNQIFWKGHAKKINTIDEKEKYSVLSYFLIEIIYLR